MQLEREDTRVLRLIQILGQHPIPDWTCPPTVLLLNKCDRIQGPAKHRLPELVQQLEVQSGAKQAKSQFNRSVQRISAQHYLDWKCMRL